MFYGKVVHKFIHKGREVVLRYPEIENVKDLLSLVNSLVEEKAYVSMQKKLTLKEETGWLLDRIKDIEELKLIYFVIEIEKKIAGSTSIEKKEVPQEHIGDFGIILKREARNIGIGQKVIPMIIKEAKKKLNIKIVMLDVYNRNKKAIHIYEKCGFKKIGKIRKGVNHYGKYLDDVLMVKYL